MINFVETFLEDRSIPLKVFSNAEELKLRSVGS